VVNAKQAEGQVGQDEVRSLTRRWIFDAPRLAVASRNIPTSTAQERPVLFAVDQ
jgi:hypothetical protein